MRVAKFLSAAAIAVLATAGPALAYGPAADALTISSSSRVSVQVSAEAEMAPVRLAFAKIKKTATAPGYMLVKNDSGRAQPFPNCENSATCITETVTVLIGRNGTATLDLPCHQLGGCKVVGPR